MADQLDLDFGDGLASFSDVTYVNLQLLGRGGSAETYLSLATSGQYRGLLFALKVFRRLSRPAWRDRFLRETIFLKTCEHPAIMRVFDEGLYRDEHPFVVAEYLPQTLAAAFQQPPSTIEKLSWTLQLLSALQYLAELQPPVIHRDIKPQNIFIKGGSCVLGDFGLMKRLEAEDGSDREMLIESLGPRMPRFYRTPDLVDYLNQGLSPTPKSDVFQLGLVLAELFTGKNPEKPMAGNNFAAPVELEGLAPVSGELAKPILAVLQAMLERDAASRPAASSLLEQWQGLFQAEAKRSHAQLGRVF